MWSVFCQSQMSSLYGFDSQKKAVEKAFLVYSSKRALMATEIKDYSGEYQRETGLSRFSFRTLSFAISLNRLFDYWLGVVVVLKGIGRSI